MLSLATSNGPPGDGGRRESALWTIHGERGIDDTWKLRLSIAQVELPDGVHFEQYVLRMPKAAITVLLDDARERVLMIWRHRFAPPSTRFVYLVQGYASGFLPTPPHGDAVASGSELAPPLPPGDLHPQSIAHAGRTQAGPTRPGRAAACIRLCARSRFAGTCVWASSCPGTDWPRPCWFCQ